MRRHTTHWCATGTLHVGTVEDCSRCHAADVAEALQTEVSRDWGWSMREGA